jgi:hypothetical protein
MRVHAWIFKVIYFSNKVITITRSFYDLPVYTVALKAICGSLFVEGRLEFDPRQSVGNLFCYCHVVKEVLRCPLPFYYMDMRE